MKLKPRKVKMTRFETYMIRKMAKSALVLFGVSLIVFAIQYLYYSCHPPQIIIPPYP
ncbi:hypothetical protein MUO56_00565 [Candidatus Bathyarchaeota archaeon]|nr:hypothetical protein [Candidatus Bathyarchaeota archaeon]